MKQKYRGECGQCDFVANSALKMEQHLLTHGIVLNTSVIGPETAKPHPKKRKGRKRATVYPKVEVKSEPLPEIELETQAEMNVDSCPVEIESETCPSNSADSEEPMVVETAKDKADNGERHEEGHFEECGLLLSERMPCHYKTGVETKTNVPTTDGCSNDDPSMGEVTVNADTSVQARPAISADESGEMSGMERLDKLSPECPQLENHFKDAEETFDEEKLNLALSDADTSSNSSASNNSFDTSATLSITGEPHLSFTSPNVKQERMDPSYELSALNFAGPSGLRLTPVSSHKTSPSHVIVKTPPDHDYIQSSPTSTEIVDSCIPEALREEFMMNCVSIKQEEFENMDLQNAASDTEQGVIVIAPQGEESEMHELCSLVKGFREDCPEPGNKAMDPNENNVAGAAHSKFLEDDKSEGKTSNLIKTSVLKSILMGEVKPPGVGTPTKEVPSTGVVIQGNKMYSLPCTFTAEGKLRLVPASNSGITHFIVVTPGTQGKPPCLFLVAKSKVQTMGPRSALLMAKTKNQTVNTENKHVKVRIQKTGQPLPSTKLKKARCDLNTVLAKAAKIAPKPDKPEKMEKIHVCPPELSTKTKDADDKIFYCRKESCSFSSTQYYSYQSHVMHCWQDHGFMVCDMPACDKSFRTKSSEEFTDHCWTMHKSVALQCCKICLFLSTNRSQVIQHYAMYHQDVYAPESPFQTLKLSDSHSAQGKKIVNQKVSPGALAKMNSSSPPKTIFLNDVTKTQPKDMTEKTMLLSLSTGLGGLTNGSVNIVNKGIGVNATKRNMTVTTPGHYVLIGPNDPKTPKKVKCSEWTSKKIKDLLNHSQNDGSFPNSDICYSAKKLEESLEPAAKLLTQTVQAKCLNDLKEIYTKRSSPLKQKVNVFIKEEPSEGLSEDSPLQAKQEPDQSAADETIHPKNTTKTVESVTETESTKEQLEIPDFNNQEEYFDGTVDESVDFDDIDQNATSEDMFADDLVTRENSSEQHDTCSTPQAVPDDLQSTSKESSVQKLLLEGKDGIKSEVLLQPLGPQPRQSGRIRKPKGNKCNLSCCVGKKKRPRKKRTLVSDVLSDIKLISKPVVVLIDIMSLVRPMLGMESPVKHTTKQTARKSTARRSRVIKKNNCACCEN